MIVKELTLHLTLPKTVSLNTLYAGKHWTFRKKKKDEYKKIVEKELANYDHYSAEGMSVRIRYNARTDVDNNVLEQRIKDVEEIQGKAPKGYKDFRKLLEQPGLDVIIIGTPDHWHAISSIDATNVAKAQHSPPIRDAPGPTRNDRDSPGTAGPRSNMHARPVPHARNAAV